MNLMSFLLDAATVVETAAEQNENSISLWEMTVNGGWIMLILGIFSMVAVYIFIERFININRAAKNDDGFMESIRNSMKEGNLAEAKELCKQTDTPLSRMIEKGISRIGKPLNDIQTAVENVGNLEVSRLEKGVALLAMISGAGPMLGFLGTVIGMIRAFFQMASAGNNIDIATLSEGIYQAMVTTVGGLIVGIIAFIFYNILVAQIDKVVNMLEAKSIEFMDVLNEPAK
ncbi:MAG: MotA/TolQ/ExbB proton channel family protein [Bacteroidales bacterium]|nr:MotA/TolQ/ExbB proton channel family protein [Bacteroidales bacterium]MBQ7533583.1 MotA/TolQ/ExbB proton channel family protein [Bacteroidales bacterium]MCR5036046.1 MotA/TolQ/ExbB proton channel family protein [Bacteroidales bacterium]